MKKVLYVSWNSMITYEAFSILCHIIAPECMDLILNVWTTNTWEQTQVRNELGLVHTFLASGRFNGS